MGGLHRRAIAFAQEFIDTSINRSESLELSALTNEERAVVILHLSDPIVPLNLGNNTLARDVILEVLVERRGGKYNETVRLAVIRGMLE